MNTCLLGVGAPRRIGFISTRFSGTDGVTLEARKWATILEGLGHSCFWMAGLLDAPPDRSYSAELMHFGHPEVRAVQDKLFGVAFRNRTVTLLPFSSRTTSSLSFSAFTRAESEPWP